MRKRHSMCMGAMLQAVFVRVCLSRFACSQAYDLLALASPSPLPTSPSICPVFLRGGKHLGCACLTVFVSHFLSILIHLSILIQKHSNTKVWHGCSHSFRGGLCSHGGVADADTGCVEWQES